LLFTLAGELSNGGLKITVQVHSLSANIGNDDCDPQAFFIGLNMILIEYLQKKYGRKAPAAITKYECTIKAMESKYSAPEIQAICKF